MDADDIEGFWIRVYLNPVNGLHIACADRSYRDLNRTLRGLAKEQTKEKYNLVRGRLINYSFELVTTDFKDQQYFDIEHKSVCDKLIKIFNEEYCDVKMTYGQVQKWVNMYLKYLFALGENRVSGISKNYQYFHIPIDNIIQDELRKDKGIARMTEPWSKINCYDTYLEYQKQVREVYLKSIPMDIEFRLFNKSFNN
ncbi:hypothetical protein [Maribacter dokdonensis]|uniref:hypothetical protein n=1 Tax=Maribacter dokdonensis TaxID=320912 RepID=UPI002732FF58|nr:hypothetical protein [Maribacter dokdonensis]MDP2525643.1 hypothetical protein [Maribacter dokdonensis]